jgi:hypothetical protein
MKALDLYLALLDHLTDETILDRVLPYLVSLLNSTESCDSIKTSTLLCLTQVVSSSFNPPRVSPTWYPDFQKIIVYFFGLVVARRHDHPVQFILIS